MKKLTLIITVLSVALAGCYNAPKKSAPASKKIMDRYDAIVLPQRATDQATVEPTYADEVMEMILNEELGEHLSKSEDVVCSWGEYDNGASVWMNMVEFEDDASTVESKCAVVIDQDAPGWKSVILQSGENVRVDFQSINEFPPQSSYGSVSEYNTAVLAEMYDDLLDNLDKIVQDGQALNNARLALRQTFSQVFQQITASPVKAESLTSEDGMDFDHAVIGPGNVKIALTENGLAEMTVSVKTTAKQYITGQ
ncbi:hypothetical protein SMSP2_00985 [Limihaloglobus sulfuriphilus]|uniref:Uncharacterized protein n=1 Tax=Limihaloglobus sulfuriphilus TaxID=1851148 RepID=A0A1Q2MD82_9BACT|nr:hypothetical protein [Limihaloglobus sulfuriphilus]AQQ70630.1 hypothetical protein SMSP2_00985 [Limihaloglobus sulfuriphilus]